MNKTFAHLKTESPFYPVFENGNAPIITTLCPERGIMGDKGVDYFYWLSVPRCTPQQIKVIAAIVAEQCGGTPAEVSAHMLAEGKIPLRALHVTTISVPLAAFL